MFRQRQITIVGWILFFILMAIPIVNIVVIVVLLFSPATNPTLKNFIFAQIILIVVGIFLFMTVLAGLIKALQDWPGMN